MNVSIVVPVLNEAAIIDRFLEYLIGENDVHEIILVDGGSTDETRTIVQSWSRRYASITLLFDSSIRGRAHQMNWGARQATGDAILFLHADCRPPHGFVNDVRQALSSGDFVGGGFLKQYDEENLMLRLYRISVNLVRTRLLRNLVGTNAMFLRRDLFVMIGMFPEVPILEDVLLCDRMKSQGRLTLVSSPVVCSARRYHRLGVWNHIKLAAKVLYLYRVKKMNLDWLKEVYTSASKG